jgi:hypothetical protein
LVFFFGRQKQDLTLTVAYVQKFVLIIAFPAEVLKMKQAPCHGVKWVFARICQKETREFYVLQNI